MPLGSDEWNDLRRAWEISVRSATPPELPVTVLFSGGLDSSLIAWTLRSRPATTLLTVGLPGSPDLAQAETAARQLSLPWTSLVPGVEELTRSWREASAFVDGATGPNRSVRLAFALALSAARDAHVLCGQGADELALGYAHFESLSVEEAARVQARDLDRLHETEWPAATRWASALGKSLASPYLVEPFVSLWRSIPIEKHLPRGGERKPTLRGLARSLGLPAALADRPKKAIQYGSGIDRWIRAQERGPGPSDSTRVPASP